jgi:hypothetical protein
MTEAKNLFNLPSDLFDLVCEKTNSHPEDPELIYRVLCEEIEIQVAGAYEHPEEEGRFQKIMQCALTLEGLRKDAAVAMRQICGECFESLVDNENGMGSCNNPGCSKYLGVDEK